MSTAKPQRPRARLPRGFRDRTAAEIAAERKALDKIRDVYQSYGFEPLETPAFEFTDALGKFLPDIDRPNEGVFSLRDDDEQWLSLRYDLTAPLARYVAENFQELPKPFRRYQVGQVWRNEKPGPGRYREFTQFDADTVGSNSPARRCRIADDGVRRAGSCWPQTWRVHREDQQPQIPQWHSSIGRRRSCESRCGVEGVGQNLIALRKTVCDYCSAKVAKMSLAISRRDPAYPLSKSRRSCGCSQMMLTT